MVMITRRALVSVLIARPRPPSEGRGAPEWEALGG